MFFFTWFGWTFGCRTKDIIPGDMNEDVYNIHTYNPFPEYARNDMYVYNLTR